MNEESKITLSYVDNQIEIKGREGGVTVDEIVSHLSNDAQSAFRNGIQSMIDEPDNAKRNAKYSDLLDSWDESLQGLFTPWRTGNLVAFENYSDETISEIRRLWLRISKRGRNGYVEDGWIFSGNRHIGFNDGRSLDFLEFSAYITPDGKIALMSPEQHDKLLNFTREYYETEREVTE